MESYTVQKLGPLQQKILKHFFRCEQRKVESINHISKSLGAKRPSVSRSVGYLIREKYLAVDRDKTALVKREAGSKFFEKALYVTDKGMLHGVVMLDVEYDSIINYVGKYDESYIRYTKQILEDKFPDKEKRELDVRKGFEFILKNNWFDERGDIRVPFTVEEKSRLRLNLLKIANEHLESVVLNNPGISSFHDLLDKARLNPTFVKECLVERKKGIDQALREIEKD